MAKTVADVMTKNPVAMGADSSVLEAARAMNDFRIGSVVVMENDKPRVAFSLLEISKG